jgi:hypothetical protein
MKRLCFALPLALIGLSLGCSSSSSSDDAGDCRKDAGGSICLVSNGPGSYRVEATGLGPASQVQVGLEAPGSDPETPMEGVADAKGSFPSAGVFGIAVGGPDDVTVTVNAISSDGSPIKAVFRR